MEQVLVIVMAGGGAAGKSTTSKAFAIGQPIEYRVKQPVPKADGSIRELWVKWTLYENCGLTGNHHSGSDSNNGPEALRIAFNEVLEERDVVIIDGYASTPKWATIVDDWAEVHPDTEVGLLLVHFALSPEEMLRRLAKRRDVTVESLVDAGYMEGNKDRKAQVRRGELVVKYFSAWKDWMSLIVVNDQSTTEGIVNLMDVAVEDYFND